MMTSVGKKLSLTTCVQDNFKFDDGLCVPLLNHCDGAPNCDDASDEADCKFIEKSNSYHQHLSPPPGDDSATKASVNVTVNIKTIQEINEIGAILVRVSMIRRLAYQTMVPL